MAEKSAEVVEGLVVRGPVNGRRTYSKAAKQALVQICRNRLANSPFWRAWIVRAYVSTQK